MKHKHIRHKKKFNRKVTVLVAFLIVLVLAADIGIYFYFNKKDTRTSIHPFAATYSEKSCRVYYPDTEKGLTKAKEICAQNTSEDGEYDFKLIKKGDYYIVDYGIGDTFYIDSDHKDLVLNKIEDSEESRKLIADNLRYNMKKDEIDEAYTSKYLYDTYYENIDLSNVDYSVDEENLYMYFKDYDYTLSLPLGYVQKYLNMNFGFEDLEYTERIHYVSPNRPVICFTFDDGPNVKESNPTSKNIVKNLDTYDSDATFFVIGSRLYNKTFDLINESVLRGNEYGSHTQSHSDITTLSTEDAINDIMIPYYDLKNNCDYEIKYFRPPYGSYTKDILNATKLKCILWNVDSLDWKLRLQDDEDKAVEDVYNQVMRTAKENKIILFHDIYKVSELASKKIMISLIDEGYQIVNVSELTESLDLTDYKMFGGY